MGSDDERASLCPSWWRGDGCLSGWLPAHPPLSVEFHIIILDDSTYCVNSLAIMKILALVSAAAWLCASATLLVAAVTIPLQGNAITKRALQGQEQVVFDTVGGTKHKKRVPVTLGVMSKCVHPGRHLQVHSINATIATDSFGPTPLPIQMSRCRGTCGFTAAEGSKSFADHAIRPRPSRSSKASWTRP